MSRPPATVRNRRDAQESRTRHRHRPALPADLFRAVIQAAHATCGHYQIASRTEADHAARLFGRGVYPAARDGSIAAT